MSKGLEAWKRLNEHDSDDESYWYGEQFDKDKETIEKELKEHEQYKTIEEEFEIDSIEDLRDRLTKYKFLANHEMSCVDVNAYNLMLKDLDEYHSIEEELGIDLVTLIKAVNDGFYYEKDNKIEFCKWCIRVGDKLVEVLPCYAVKETTIYSCYYGAVEKFKPVKDAHYWSWRTCVSVSLKDYGKTWALTKEELL